jgi:hypothetical protein
MIGYLGQSAKKKIASMPYSVVESYAVPLILQFVRSRQNILCTVYAIEP